MTTLLGEKMKEALNKKSVDVNSFVWKGAKVLDEEGKYRQQEIKLVDMSKQELSNCYEHCKKMLFNKDVQNPGRYIVMENIPDQKDRCGAELFLRFVDQEYNMSRFTMLNNLTTFIENNKEVFKDKKPVLKDMFNSIPNEFENLSLNLIIDGCLDRLGAFNKKHITRTFILKQGIWLTPPEAKELLEGEDPSRDRLEIIRERLNIKDVEKLYINSRGINYTQMRAMLGLRPNKKYTDLTTVQLETLRNRLLFDLEETIKNHIFSWERRMEEIELVSTHNNIRL